MNLLLANTMFIHEIIASNFLNVFHFRYPQCLHMLELLQYEHLRKELSNSQCAKFIDDQQLLHWQHYHRKRMRLLDKQAEAVAQTHDNKSQLHVSK